MPEEIFAIELVFIVVLATSFDIAKVVVEDEERISSSY